MVQLEHAKFLAELQKLFLATRDKGSLSITHKRLEDYAAKKAAKRDDATAATADAGATAKARHSVMVRARTEKKKLSTIVADKDLVKFQVQLAAIIRDKASSLKRKERAKKPPKSKS
mmetsp:Transcript_2631/g.7841  ORF Transcript_2631/g.7841 Transcript_2631/m.7841 type:complete len:117 (+) Transcript_2631:314-664(+)